MINIQSIQFLDSWHQTFAGGHIGLLLIGTVDNAKRATSLDVHKRELEATLREQYVNTTRAELLARIKALAIYKKYYRHFNKTYHVQLQLESVLYKGKMLPNVTPMVDACFAAELETQLLTASHDVGLLVEPISFRASVSGEEIVQLNGKKKVMKAGDMVMRDGQETVCSIIYGQEPRTAVSPKTSHVLYVTYAPAGIGETAVSHHHDTLIHNVQLFAPDVTAEQRIVTAGE